MAGRPIDNEFIKQLVENSDLVNIVGKTVKLKRSGRNYMGLCPFHQEKTPSFSVSSEKNIFHCFGCQMSGNAIHFIRHTEHLDFLPAVERLAEIEGIPVVYAQGEHRSSDADVNYAVLCLAKDFYAQHLATDTSGVLGQLEERGISAETVKAYELGLAPPKTDAFWGSLREEKLRAAALRLSIVKQGDKGDIYDFFRNRIIFPIHDNRKRPIGFGGRSLDDKGAKYINSPESILFSKGKEFYGLPQALGLKNKEEGITLVEGYTDVLAFGLQKRVMACLGTAFTREHAQKLFRHTSRILFAFDGDAAGEKAALRAVSQCLPFINDNRRLSVLFLPAGEDPNSLLLKGGLQAWNDLTETSLEQFLLKDLRAASDMHAKADAAKRLEGYLALMPESYQKKLIHKEAQDVAGIELHLPETSPPLRSAASRSKRQEVVAPSIHLPDRLHRLALAFLADTHLACKAQELWQEELEQACSSQKDEIIWVADLLESAAKGSDYLYGWLQGKGFYFGDMMQTSPAGKWVLEDVGELLRNYYREEKENAVKKEEKNKLKDIKNHIVAVNRKISTL